MYEMIIAELIQYFSNKCLLKNNIKLKSVNDLCDTCKTLPPYDIHNTCIKHELNAAIIMTIDTRQYGNSK